MSEQFRELERPAGARNKDVVLMATVTSFQALSYPGRSELKQFAELFQPLFANSSVEARRDAVAALSQSPNLPLSIAAFIASQPIAIAATFLASSPALSDDMLIMIARTQGAEHARAIVKRERLSPTVIDALVGLRHALPPRPARAAVRADVAPGASPSTFEQTMAELEMPHLAIGAPAITAGPSDRASPTTGFAAGLVARLQAEVVEPARGAANAGGPETGTEPRADVSKAREEVLRQTIKRLAYQQAPGSADRLGRRQVGPVQTALLVRFARAFDGGAFATTLADMLSSSRWLAERILLDISGRQLATTLAGVAMAEADSVFILEHIYPHLARTENGSSRAQLLIGSLDPDAAEARIDSWLRADRYTFGEMESEVDRDMTRPPEGLVKPARPTPNAASRKPVGDEHARQVLRARKR